MQLFLIKDFDFNTLDSMKKAKLQNSFLMFILIYIRSLKNSKIHHIPIWKIFKWSPKPNSNILLIASQSKRFYNMANLSGVVLFLAFLKFPLVRVQPGFRRVGLAGALAYPCYAWMYSIAENLLTKKGIINNKCSLICLSQKSSRS